MAEGTKGMEKMGVRGFFHIQIEEDGRIVGDSGRIENTVVNLGFNQYLVSNLGAIAGSKQITHAMLGTGTAPGVTDTDLDGELTDVAGTRVSLTAATSSSSKTLRFTGTLASGVYTAAHNISNIGLINHSSTATAGTIFAGTTYASSALASNQAVNLTYDIIFS